MHAQGLPGTFQPRPQPSPWWLDCFDDGDSKYSVHLQANKQSQSFLSEHQEAQTDTQTASQTVRQLDNQSSQNILVIWNVHPVVIETSHRYTLCISPFFVIPASETAGLKLSTEHQVLRNTHERNMKTHTEISKCLVFSYGKLLKQKEKQNKNKKETEICHHYVSQKL